MTDQTMTDRLRCTDARNRDPVCDCKCHDWCPDTSCERCCSRQYGACIDCIGADSYCCGTWTIASPWHTVPLGLENFACIRMWKRGQADSDKEDYFLMLRCIGTSIVLFGLFFDEWMLIVGGLTVEEMRCMGEGKSALGVVRSSILPENIVSQCSYRYTAAWYVAQDSPIDQHTVSSAMESLAFGPNVRPDGRLDESQSNSYPSCVQFVQQDRIVIDVGTVHPKYRHREPHPCFQFLHLSISEWREVVELCTPTPCDVMGSDTDPDSD